MLILQTQIIVQSSTLSNAVHIKTPAPVMASIAPPINGPTATPSVDNVEAPR